MKTMRGTIPALTTMIISTAILLHNGASLDTTVIVDLGLGVFVFGFVRGKIINDRARVGIHMPPDISEDSHSHSDN